MSNTEAAASLFGPEDSSSDLFAVLGTEANRETSDDLHTGATADSSANSAAADLFDNFGDQPVSSGETAIVSQNQPAIHGHGGGSDPYAPTYNGNRTPETYGMHGTHAQWNENQSYYGAVDKDNTSYDSNRYLPPAPRDPYTPSQSSTYAPSSNYQPAVPYPPGFAYPGSQTSTYDTHNRSEPYVPPQPMNPAQYVPYNAYTSTTSGKSNASAYEPPYAVPQAPSYSAPPVPPPQANLATVPAPPPPTTVQLTRPKLSNAYDPPFPATTYSRRSASGRPGLGTTTTQSAYGAYQLPTPPPLPPTTARLPPVPPAHAPLQPVGQTPAYPSAYTTPPTRTQLTRTDGPAAATHVSSVLPPPPASESELHAPSGGIVAQPRWSPPQADDMHPDVKNGISDNRVLPTQPEADSFDQYSQQGSRLNPQDLVTTEPQSSPIPPPTVSTSPNDTVQYSSNAPVPSSPRQLDKMVPASRETSLDLRHVSSPRQSPRPPSTTSPVYGLSHTPRASPDLYRSSLVRDEHTPGPRTASPGFHGLIDTRGPHVPPQATTRPKVGSMTSVDRIGSPVSSQNAVYDRYVPRGTRVTNVYGVERTGSPSSFSTRSPDSRQDIKPQHTSYLPPVSETPHVLAPLSQEPNSVVQDPYAPSQNNQAIKPSLASIGYGQSPYGYGGDLQPQEVTIKPTITPYAPSPSLVGANDPLGRASARVPVVTFGFGGKLITCFHDAGAPSTGFDVALSSRTSTKVQIRIWKNLLPESALDSATTFPGPLYGDPGPPSTGIMKATAAVQAKTKKAQVLKYLSDRSEEITQGLGYLHNGSVEKRMAEGKLALVKLLKVIVDNDGRLLGTPQLDSAVRVALVPRLEGLVSSGDLGANFTTTADAAGLLADSPFGSLVPGGSEMAPISVTTLRAASLDKIEEFLLRGERRQAYHHALDERLWAHAMVIASSINKEAWKEVVSEFIRSELGVKVDNHIALPGRSGGQASSVNGREGLRVAYSLFSGQGSTAVQELVPKNVLAKANGRLPISAPTIPAPSLGQATPQTPNFAIPAVGAKIPPESLSKWAETVAMMISSPLTTDASAALTALGDQLLANGWIEAAHVCFLLSPQTSPLGGVGNPAARIVLLGSKSPASLPSFSRDPDSIIFTEILESALASAAVPKGQEPYHGIPHLQAYRLIRAFAAAEIGDLGIAGRYCEAITASLTRGSVHFTPTMLEELKVLADRLSGVSHSDKPNSWMAGKISKPSLDTIGGWLEGSFTKLVTGGSDNPSSPQEESRKSDTQGFAGPFAHYNTISSTTSSARSSPQPTFVIPAYALPPRTGSPMSNKASYGYGIDRSLSAVEPSRRKGSGAAPPQALSASASVTSFRSIQAQWNNYNPTTNGYSSDSDLQTPKPPHHDDRGDERNTQEVTWWGSAGHGDEGKTPTATRFEKVEGSNGGMDSDGLFSPMNTQTFSIGPQSSSGSSRHGQQTSYDDDDDDDDDLGLGNNNSKKKQQEGDNRQDGRATAPAKVEEKKPETQPAQQQSSRGWLSRWWRRSENTSGGPIKASLGEESSFYYDKDLKRWVNKRAGAETPKETPPPPPPPPRAQTASPAMMGPKPPGANGTANGNGPGLRSVSTGAVDLSTSPPSNKPATRVRSSLAPPGLDSAPPTPTGTGFASGAPPPSRPKSQASQKRNIRSRYVDVFAQEGSGSEA